MSVITTYLNDVAETPLGWFVVYMLHRGYNMIKHCDKTSLCGRGDGRGFVLKDQ